MKSLSAEWFAELRRYDTPSICNAIETAQGKRGFQGFTRRTVLVADSKLPPVVGFAKTARIKASAPSPEPVDVIKARRMAYYEYMSQEPRPAVTVIQDLDWPDCVGAFWGEVNSTVHKAFGIQGVLTNGVMRDLGAIAPDFQMLAGSIGPSHAFVHVVDYGEPVDVFGLTVKSGDIIHADQHGAVIIPADVAGEILQALAKMIDAEMAILEPARRKNFGFAEFKVAWSEFERKRT